MVVQIVRERFRLTLLLIFKQLCLDCEKTPCDEQSDCNSEEYPGETSLDGRHSNVSSLLLIYNLLSSFLLKLIQILIFARGTESSTTITDNVI